MQQPHRLRRATHARTLLLVAAAALSAIGVGGARAADTAVASTEALAGDSTFVSQADARVEEAEPSTNFGDGYLRADGGSDPAVESYLRFDVGNVTAPVLRATLRLYASSFTADGPAVYPGGDGWSEGELTWANRPGRTGPAAADAGVVLTGSWIEYDVTELVRGNGTYTFVLAGDDSDGVNFRSREQTPPPELVVSTDTEPPSTPAGLLQTAATQTSISLIWTPSLDNVGVAGYDLYLDGSKVGTTTATSHTFGDLTCGSSHTLGVEARDDAGNHSGRAQLAAATSACAAPPPAASECHKFASPSGSDTNIGTAAEPFQTPQRLAESLSAGQTGCLRAGVYDQTSGGFVLDLSRGGLTIRSYPGEVAKLVGIVMIEERAPDVTLSHLHIEGTGGANTIKIYASDVVVEDSDITNGARGDSCMILGSNTGYGQAIRPVVRRNRFHDCGSADHGNQDHGIYAQNVLEGQIVGNVFWNSAAYAIQLYPNAQRTVFARNVVDGDTPSVRGGVVFGGDSSYASSDNIVEQNVIAYAATYNITTSWSGSVGSGNIARNNCLWAGNRGNIDTSGGGFTASGNLIADPLFLDRATRDYRLGLTSLCRTVVDLDAAAQLP